METTSHNFIPNLNDLYVVDIELQDSFQTIMKDTITFFYTQASKVCMIATMNAY